jgi:hypothetical protein
VSEIKYGGFSIEFPEFETFNKYLISRDTVHIYYQGSMVLYALPYQRETFINDVSIDFRKYFHYFMAERNSQKGLFFPSLLDTAKRKWLLKDSVLAIGNIKDYKLNELLAYDSLIMRTISPDSILMEKYISINAYKGKLIDTVECSFSFRMGNFPYSLSPSLDSTNFWKLIKIRMVYNSRYCPEMKTDIPKQIWTCELFQQKLTDINLKKIAPFFLIAKELYMEKTPK